MAASSETSLPVELWSRIVQFLSSCDIQNLVLTCRYLHSCASAHNWRRLTLCTSEPQQLERIQSIIRNPGLGHHVKHLRFKPRDWANGETMHTSLWVEDNPTWWGLLDSRYWFAPSKSRRHLIQSRESIEAATKVIPHLTNLHEITVIPSFSQSRHPVSRPYCVLWASLRVERIRRLNLQLHSVGVLQVFSKAIRESNIIFHCLDILSLDLGYRLPDYPGLENDLRAIADCGRDNVTICGFFLPSRPGPHFSKVISALGCFPKLSQLHLKVFQSSWEPDPTRDYLIPFLIKHRSVLSRLQLSSYFFDQTFPESIFVPHTATSLPLSALSITCDPIPYTRFPGPVPSIARFGDTLTTLVLDLSPSSRGWLYKELHDLFIHLHKPSHGILLRRFMTRVLRLSPDIFDLMSDHLEKLETLELGYTKLVGANGLDDSDEDLFKHNLGTRTYTSWGLRRLHLRSMYSSLPSALLMEFVADRIPSVKEFGPFDWSDICLKIGPLY
ncbi:hypothetical protein BDN72DRAFT_963743 [Pluteus cervinus]|uniref:Uncharacterized protein n=1 Tax=Pluteus cervinus TaxID=181527 RepID=A0ACD3AEA0_9AGAR|nr:hypothetical protein BDN72DRAFT_963743 [Pluteus cervinus]